jgi:hypothetical protein
MAHFPQAATLFASATRTAAVTNSVGTAVSDLARASRAIVTLDVTAMAGAGGDVLDVYVDTEVSPGKFVNAAHFTQVAGNGAAQTKVVILDPSNPGTAEINVTSDAAAGAVRPAVWGISLRGRYTLVDAGAHGQSATFSLSVLLQ